MADGKNRVRIIDIARVMGLSKSTVSRALMDHGRVSPETVQAVRETARQLGYIRDRGAAQLGGAHTLAIGLVVRTADLPFYNQLAGAIYRESEKIGAEVLMVPGSGDMGKQYSVLNSLLERRVDGIIVASGRANVNAIEQISAIAPVVVVGLDREITSADTIVIDSEGEEQLAALVVQAGHKKVGVLRTPHEVSWTLAERAKRMTEVLKAAGVEVIDLEEGETIDRELLRKIMQEYKDGMTAIMAGNDVQALLIMNYFQTNGIKIPDDLSITGFDGSTDYINELIGLTTWRQPLTDLAKQGVNLLVERIEKQDMESRRVSCPGQMILGRTLKQR